MKFTKRTYLVLLSLVVLWCGGILLAPAVSAITPGVSSFLYSFYSPICHQTDARSFHLFGEKLAVCIRCSSIYGSFFLSLLAFAFTQRLSAPLVPKRLWIMLAILPMVVDVLLNVFGIHVSTMLTRVVTGALFGSILPFYVVPPLLEGIAQLRNQYVARGGFVYARKT
jgi:uncharacterized membrane protein